MENQNNILICLSKDCNRVTEIHLNVKKMHLDLVVGLLARAFKIPFWGSLRYLVQYEGAVLFREDGVKQ